MTKEHHNVPLNRKMRLTKINNCSTLPAQKRKKIIKVIGKGRGARIPLHRPFKERAERLEVLTGDGATRQEADVKKIVSVHIPADDNKPGVREGAGIQPLYQISPLGPLCQPG